MAAQPALRAHTVVTLFVPTARTSVEDLAQKLSKEFRVAPDGSALEAESLGLRVGLHFEPNPEDGSFAEAFSFGTCTDEDLALIDSAPGALVLELPAELHSSRAPIAKLAHALHQAGAIAFRIEQSKAGYDAATWLKLIDDGGPHALYRLAVIGLGGQSEARTIGMHAFSCPDVEIEATGAEAQLWLDAFALYQIAEDPLFASGQTFSPDAETQRRIIEWWPDTMYPEGHACHNPFGVLHLGPPVSQGRPQAKLRMNFMPPLRVLLEAARSKKGVALSDEEILSLRDQGVCIAMEPRDARELERSRGYADIDAERVLECWRAIEESLEPPDDDEADEAAEAADEADEP
jgi:hypothetical protein